MAEAKGRRQRYRGPALGGRLRCPNNPASMRKDPARVPTANCDPATDCACSKTIVIDDPEQLRTRQRHLFGTYSWFRHARRRSHVEAANANLKQHKDNFNRRTIQVRTLWRRALLLAFRIAAVNAKVIASAIAKGRDLSTPVSPGRTKRRSVPKIQAEARATARRGPPAR